MQANNTAILKANDNPLERVQAALSVKPVPDKGNCSSCRQLPEAVRQAIFDLIKAAVASV